MHLRGWARGAAQVGRLLDDDYLSISREEVALEAEGGVDEGQNVGSGTADQDQALCFGSWVPCSGLL